MTKPAIVLVILSLFLFIDSTIAFSLPSWCHLDYFRSLQWTTTTTRDTDMISDCSDEKYILDIQNITLTPPDPKPGDELLIEATGYLKERVDYGAYADVTVALNRRFILLRKTFDICEEMEKNDAQIKCPVEPGLLKVTQTVTLPKEVPKARFLVHVRANNYNEAKLACLNVVADFRH
ncbi:hypothetical protein VTP01DRAFT_1187 [Rhizomucor pusillus]|uniref:uncharacterized protein n=1 Tax=Rhizomucor pusillus TaxID=4840 RepID=UPI003742790D